MLFIFFINYLLVIEKSIFGSLKNLRHAINHVETDQLPERISRTILSQVKIRTWKIKFKFSIRWKWKLPKNNFGPTSSPCRNTFSPLLGNTTLLWACTHCLIYSSSLTDSEPSIIGPRILVSFSFFLFRNMRLFKG